MKAQDFIHQAQLLGENQHVRFTSQIMKKQRREIRLLLIYIPVIGMKKCLAKTLKNSIQIGAPSGQNVYGLSFGLGMHSCIGRNLAAGVVPKEDTDPNDHHYGTVALILNKLFEYNAQPDPTMLQKWMRKQKGQIGVLSDNF